MNNVESKIYKGVEKTLLQLKEELKSKGISYDLSFHNSGVGDSYFSEIEVAFWKDDNVLDEISVIIYLEGKKRNTEEIFLDWFKDELAEVIAVE